MNRPALLHELQRLEYKVNILLRLTAELAAAQQRAAARGPGPVDLARPGMVRRANAPRWRHRFAGGVYQSRPCRSR